VLTATIK